VFGITITFCCFFLYCLCMYMKMNVVKYIFVFKPEVLSHRNIGRVCWLKLCLKLSGQKVSSDSPGGVAQSTSHLPQ
jgi:hypothetical protein